MPGLQVKDPAERFDLAYLWADGNSQRIAELGATAEGINARCAMVHIADLAELVPHLKDSAVRAEVVIDFPDGLGGRFAKLAEARGARGMGARGGDVVVNLRHITARNWRELSYDCGAVFAEIGETKLIAQIPYLWMYDKEAIPWLIDFLPEWRIYCLKDWTTRKNFSCEVDTSTETRLKYTEYISNYIAKRGLNLLVKIAGGVDATNAKQFVDAGADLLGLSYQKAVLVREALL